MDNAAPTVPGFQIAICREKPLPLVKR